MRPNRKTNGMRKAKSVSDGNSLTANCGSGGFHLIVYAIQEFATGCIASYRTNSIVERTEIHVIHPQGNARAVPALRR